MGGDGATGNDISGDIHIVVALRATDSDVSDDYSKIVSAAGMVSAAASTDVILSERGEW